VTNLRHYPSSYDESRVNFLEDFEQIKKIWPNARLVSRPLPAGDGLTMDWIAADPYESYQKVVIITSGIHGVEAFVGNRLRMLFIDEFMEKLDPTHTGLYMVHAINPWGMKNQRRVTKRNVDLNRNFVLEGEKFLEGINPDYRLYDHILNPDRQLYPLWREILAVLGSVIGNLVRKGVKSLRNAVLQGQRFNPDGLYYSGIEYEPETRELMGLFKDIFRKYPSALMIDMHTGYGPKYQMSIINSQEEPREAAQLVAEFNYPLILKANPEEFYTMQGDMVDWLYKYRRSSGLDGKFYAAAFEFGTIGENILHEVISLWNMIFENQAYRHGSLKEQTKRKVEQTMLEMYFPSEEKWREKALLDCTQAFSGILEAEGYLK
jgi:predicted deacylase